MRKGNLDDDENDEWHLLEAVDGDALSRFLEEDYLPIPCPLLAIAVLGKYHYHSGDGCRSG